MAKRKSERNEKKRYFLKIQKLRKEKTMRKAGGDIWIDETLDEWPDKDYRLFVGNLGKI